MMSFGAACRQRGLDRAAVLEELQDVCKGSEEKGPDFFTWELSSLIDHIVRVHHGYLLENIKKIGVYAHEIARSHGLYHPELSKVAGFFDKLADDLMPHLRKEENAFFPFIKKVEMAIKTASVPEKEDIEIIRNFLPTVIPG